jgi:hypothetical protein
LLLDADLAARSASLARIYNNLGFQQLALLEGGNRSISIQVIFLRTGSWPTPTLHCHAMRLPGSASLAVTTVTTH